MGYLKGKSALMMFDKHANLKYKFGNRHFWAEGYYVSTVGINEATVAKYIREQEKRDIALDKLSVKEYEDPFRGSRQNNTNTLLRSSYESRAIRLEPSQRLETQPVTGAYSPREQTARFTGGADF